MRAFAKVIVVCFLLCGCGALGGLQEGDASQQIKSYLEENSPRTQLIWQRSNPPPRQVGLCWVINRVEVRDRRIDGDTAEVEADAFVSIIFPIHERCRGIRAMPDSIQELQGRPQGTELAISVSASFERWESGWRIVDADVDAD